MSLPKRYNPRTAEPLLEKEWRENGLYRYELDSDVPAYTIDTPPPTVSGHLHLGHVYSYSHPDFMARFWRMNGRNVFYPMGFDDNGLPTERLVEKWEGITPQEVGREKFIERCITVSDQAIDEYRALWQRLGLSVDWEYTYRTNDENSRRISQLSFLDLYEKGLAYRQQAPSIWCPECQTAIAQAELDDLDRETRFYTLDFRLPDGDTLPIATTRPELLPACVAIFIHPDDMRYAHLLGELAIVPHFGQQVAILSDPGADPQKGTGVVMCCTFGDTADVEWWRRHQLPLVEAIGRDGRMTDAAGDYRELPTSEARSRIVADLNFEGLLLDEQSLSQSVRVHERCDTPVEYIITWQWFVKVLEEKERFLAAGEAIAWHPAHMKSRYRDWVENLGWDWCITRQRTHGVPFPVWYCDVCGEVQVAHEDDLPVNPLEEAPDRPCTCGSNRFRPETDVMDTWATSSLTPQIVGQWLTNERLYQAVFPMSLRPQSHEIIRTWAFYTIVKSHYHFDTLPWQEAFISGWGLAPEGTEKLSKSRGGGPVSPMEMIERYSADAVRYWAASTGPGKDAIISEDRIRAGTKFITKLWNVARFSQRFLQDYQPPVELPLLTPADRWILNRTNKLIGRVTDHFQNYDYASAKSEIESFFWRDLADNYLEMAKKRLYDAVGADGSEGLAHGGRYALYHTLATTLKLLAPILPFVTEHIYGGLFAEEGRSIHRAEWPATNWQWEDEEAEKVGELLVEIATAVRRYKSESGLSLGTELETLQLATEDESAVAWLIAGAADLNSITRARTVEARRCLGADVTRIGAAKHIDIGVRMQ